MFKQKYKVDQKGIKGMLDAPVIMKDHGKKQYPNEQFYHLFKKEL